MSEDSKFLHHAPCEECGSRDNKGVWDDGHTYCFGCGHMTPPTHSLESLRNKISNLVSPKDSKGNLIIDVSKYSTVIPKHPLAWIKKYGITDSEIKHHKLMWNPQTDSLVFPVFNRSNEIMCTNERYFGYNSNHPKYITHGSKEKNFLIIQNDKFVKDTVIVVEDFISAIKVSRQLTSLPLLGSTMPANRLKTLSDRFKSVRVWLDMDKASESLRIASRASQWIPDSSSIFTELDPKEYGDIDIATFLVKTLTKNKGPLDPETS